MKSSIARRNIILRSHSYQKARGQVDHAVTFGLWGYGDLACRCVDKYIIYVCPKKSNKIK